MNFYHPCEVVSAVPSPPRSCFNYFFSVETKFPTYVNAKSKVTSEFVFHHVGITSLISLGFDL